MWQDLKNKEEGNGIVVTQLRYIYQIWQGATHLTFYISMGYEKIYP